MPESPFYAAVESRRTVRDFLPDPVPQEVLDRALDAARLAPSSSNLQPWEFVIIRDPAIRRSAEAACLDQGPAKTAPVLIALVTHRDTWRRNRDGYCSGRQGRQRSSVSAELRYSGFRVAYGWI